MQNKTIYSPTGISSIEMNQTSNQTSAYSFAAPTKMSGKNMGEIIDEYALRKSRNEEMLEKMKSADSRKSRKSSK